MTTMIHVENVAKAFTLHNQGGVRLPVFDNVNFSVAAGEALVLAGASGAGKSSLLRILYGNYRPTSGRIRDHPCRAANRHRPGRAAHRARHPPAHARLRLAVPARHPARLALDIVRDPLLARGVDPQEASERASAMLARLNLPERLWNLAPATFSGGEQQRVNIARSFVDPSAVMLIDEPTASLDAANRDVVVELIDEARQKGSAIVGIFHDEAVRERVATRYLDITDFRKAA